MAQQDKSSHSGSKSAHMHPKASRHTEAAADIQGKTLEMGCENVENLMHAADACNKTAGQLAGVCSENISAMIESGSRASRIPQEVAAEIMDSNNRAFSDCAEISKDVFSCRTIKDVVELQNRAVRQLSDNYFTTVNKVSNTLFHSYSEAMEPFYEHTAIASDQFRKAMAA